MQKPTALCSFNQKDPNGKMSQLLDEIANKFSVIEFNEENFEMNITYGGLSFLIQIEYEKEMQDTGDMSFEEVVVFKGYKLLCPICQIEALEGKNHYETCHNFLKFGQEFGGDGFLTKSLEFFGSQICVVDEFHHADYSTLIKTMSKFIQTYHEANLYLRQ